MALQDAHRPGRRQSPFLPWRTYCSAIWALAAIVIGTLISIVWLSLGAEATAASNAQGLIAIGSAAVGGLAGMLTLSRDKD